MPISPWLRDLPATRSARASGRYLLVYDVGCGFCAAAARWIERRARRPLELVGLSEYDPAVGYLGSLSAAELGASAHFITPKGREYHGGQAITRALRLWRWGWLVAPLDLPGVSMLRAAGYQVVARSRGRLRLPRWR